LAEEQGCDVGVITFTNHHDLLVSGDNPPLLNSTEDRKTLLYSYGVDTVTELPFDEKLMRTHWSAFLLSLVEAGAAGFVCGSDFRFGTGGCGTAPKLEAFCQERNLPCAIVPQQEMEGVRVSSTHIRALIEQGEMEKAVAFLGHPHILSGEVVHGRGLGHTIGIPTANLQLPEGVICPKFGVYATKVVTDGKEYLAVTNIGTRPTVAGEGITVEAHLLDFAGDLYGKWITVIFYEFLRPEQKFADLDALKTQIAADVAQVRAVLK
jgi:riboflavin kinase/FMN adenylyltransferase